MEKKKVKIEVELDEDMISNPFCVKEEQK